MPHDEAAQLARHLEAAAEPARLRILSLVLSHVHGEACLCDIVDDISRTFGLFETEIRRHLQVLQEAGLLTSQARGAWVYYRATDARDRLLTRLARKPTIV